MPQDQTINLLASLKKVGKDGKTAIRIESEDLFFDPDDKPLAKALANAIVVQLKENLQKGLGPGGEQLPTISSATFERRKDEVEQARRGGQAHERFTKNEFRHTVQNNFTRDYTAPRLGHFTPKENGPRGIVSGMLASSFAARAMPDGRGMTVYVAAKRGSPRPAGSSGRRAETKSALEVVYGTVPIWSPAAWNDPKMKKKLSDAAKSMLGKNRLDMKKIRKQLTKLAGTLFDTAEALQAFAEDAEG